MLTLDALRAIVTTDAALRRVQRLQPIGGPGDKIMPAIYGGRKYAIEHRRIDGAVVPCALLSSVSAQARRMGMTLLAAVRSGVIPIPYVAVDFSEFPGLVDDDEVTSLDAPHRIYDAILRDSETLDGTPFPRTPLYQALDAASPRQSGAVFSTSPTSLLFGTWNSTSGRRRGGAFARCIASEIIAAAIAVDPDGRYDGVRTAGRIDPLMIGRTHAIAADETEGWVIDPRGRGDLTPAEINHGNIMPQLLPGGVSADHCRHVAVISCAALRRCRIPGAAETTAHAMLAALGLMALLVPARDVYSLRSFCDLVPDGLARLEVVRRDGTVEGLDIDGAGAIVLAQEAIAAARRQLPWGAEPLRLRPQAKLVELVRRSQLERAAGGEDEGDDE